MGADALTSRFVAEHENMEPIYMMGFDVWHGGAARDAYLRGCRSSPKYSQGRWFVLQSGSEPCSSMIVYQQGFALPPGCLGIGSIATQPIHRKQGLATRMIDEFLQRPMSRAAPAIYLHSDIDVRFYQRHGFEAVGTTRGPSTAMVRLAAHSTSQHRQQCIDYF